MKLGKAKGDITAFVKNVGMLGYGMFFNRMKNIASPLYCRSFAFTSDDKRVVIAICELAFITDSLKQGILQKLEGFNIGDDELLLLAQHTHSGPGGYSHYAFYNFTTPGFVPEIFDQLVEKISNCIIQSLEESVDVNLFVGKSYFDEKDEVAFNRSLHAYNQNKDVEALDSDQKHLAVNREMTLLDMQDAHGHAIASINWFGVHTTSISNDNHSLSSDNKGYAASYLEDAMPAGYIGAFAQGACGDVSPKFIFNPKRKAQRGFWEGKFADDFESAKYNGKLQFLKAKEILHSATKAAVQGQQIQSFIQYFDFSNIAIDPYYTGGLTDKFTSPACQGMAFLGGAKVDGPGAPRILEVIGKKLSRKIRQRELHDNTLSAAEQLRIQKKYQAQGNKDIIIESGEGRVMGSADVKNIILPGILDGGILNMKKQHRKGALITKQWTPQILPIHWTQLGDLLIVGLPFEITTVASYRLQHSMKELVSTTAIKEIILCPYANSYNGYITTFEEYQVQMYEGGHTVFGEWSLAALQTCLKKMYQNVIENKPDHTLQPLVFSKEEIAKRTYGKY